MSLSQTQPQPSEKDKGISYFRKFQYDENKDSPHDVRNVLLVIVALIATVTFQAGVNPPGGVWQEDDAAEHHKAGNAIYASNKIAFRVFLLANTLALSTCILVFLSLTYKFPFIFEIWVATVSMIVTYASAVFAVTPHECVQFRYVLITAAVPFVLRLLNELFKRLKNKKERQVEEQRVEANE